ncbi:MAG TPA: hypothetical protein VJU82_07750, partial [Acidobacteriaceae bacterium]|nr:hypothetical protein [Acidobacteriaceae bacterium]
MRARALLLSIAFGRVEAAKSWTAGHGPFFATAPATILTGPLVAFLKSRTFPPPVWAAVWAAIRATIRIRTSAIAISTLRSRATLRPVLKSPRRTRSVAEFTPFETRPLVFRSGPPWRRKFAGAVARPAQTIFLPWFIEAARWRFAGRLPERATLALIAGARAGLEPLAAS